MFRFLLIPSLLLFISISAFSSIDSLLSEIKHKPIGNQLEILANLPFDLIVSNSQRLIPVFHEHILVASRQRNTDLLAKLYINLSLVYYYRGKYDENLFYGLKAIQLLDSLKELSKLGTMYGELGYQTKRRDLAKAFELMRKGKRILEDIGENEPLAKIYDNYGVLHEINENYDSALFFYRKALYIKKEMQDSLGIPFSLNNIFSLYLITNRFDSAQWYLNQSTIIRQRRNDQHGLAENYTYQGDFFVQTEQYHKAIEFYKKALKLADQYGYTFLLQNLYKNISLAFELTENYIEALNYQKLHKQYHDSIVNIETNATIANLQIQFETAEKEKELALKNQELVRERATKSTIAVLSILLIVTILLFYRYKQLIARRNERIRIQNALIEGEQSERNRLALELHDGVANDLNSIIIAMSNDYLESNARVEKGIEKLRDAHQTVRKLSHTLMPRSLKDKGLIAAIEELVASFSSEKLIISFQNQGVGVALRNVIEFNVFRIIQESINNIIKHSKASHVLIDFNVIDGLLMLSIEDNGIGFRQSEVNDTNSWGISNISNRVKMLEGNLHIRSEPGGGTTIDIQIPL